MLPPRLDQSGSIVLKGEDGFGVQLQPLAHAPLNIVPVLRGQSRVQLSRGLYACTHRLITSDQRRFYLLTFEGILLD